MHTVILAGGFGTRLQSVLENLPKPLAPVNNKSFLEYLIEQLKKNELKDFTFCLHYMAEKIVEIFNDGSEFGVKINYSIEEKPMGTAGAIGLLKNSLNETFCVINADTYLELDIQECVEKHKNSDAIATIAVTQVKNLSRYGKVELDDEGMIKSFCEKGKYLSQDGYINAGLYIFEPSIFDYIPENKFVSFEKDVFSVLLKDKKKINSYSKVANFFDIGVPVDYYSFQQWASNLERVKS